MFQTSFEKYSNRTQRIEDNLKAQQKSARISEATTGKKKTRKAKNKGKHRTRTVETGGTLRDTTTRRSGESITTNVNIIRRGNRRGQGRPPATAPSRATRYGSAPSTAFGPRRGTTEDTGTTQILREIRRILQPQQGGGAQQQGAGGPPRAPPPPNQQQRDADRRAEAERRRREERERARERQQREAERQQQTAFEQGIAQQRERREDERLRLEARRIDVEGRRAEAEARGIAEINARIAGLDATVRAGQPIAPPQITVSPNIEVNPNISVNPTFNNYGNADAQRRGRRAVGGRRGGGGGRQNFRGSDTDSSESGGGGGRGGGRRGARERRQQRAETTSESDTDSSGGEFGGEEQFRRNLPRRSGSPGTKRARQREAIEKRSPQQPTPPEGGESEPAREPETLFQTVGGGIQTAGEIGAGAIGTAGSVIARGAGGVVTGVASRLPTAEAVGQTIGGGLADVAGVAGRTGLGVATAVGGRVAEQLPTGEDVVAGASNLLAEAMRPQQEEQPADPSLLESISDVDISGSEAVVPFEARAPEGSPRKTIAETIRERQAIEQRQLLEQQEEDERNRRIREARRRKTQEEAEQGEQAGILADIGQQIARTVSSGGRRAVSVAGDLLSEAVSQGIEAVSEKVNPGFSPREVGRATTTLSARRNIRGEEGEAFSSEGEGAGQVLIKTDEPQSEFREDYFTLDRENPEGFILNDSIEFSDGRRGRISQFITPRDDPGIPHTSIGDEEVTGRPNVLITFSDGEEAGVTLTQVRKAVEDGRVSRRKPKVTFASPKAPPPAPQPEPEPTPEPAPKAPVKPPLPDRPSPREQPNLRRQRSATPASGPPSPATSGDESSGAETSGSEKEQKPLGGGDLLRQMLNEPTSSSSEAESSSAESASGSGSSSGSETDTSGSSGTVVSTKSEFEELSEDEKYRQLRRRRQTKFNDIEDRQIVVYRAPDGGMADKGVIRVDGVLYRRDKNRVLDGNGKIIAYLDIKGKDIAFINDGDGGVEDEAMNHYRRLSKMNVDEFEDHRMGHQIDDEPSVNDGKSFDVAPAMPEKLLFGGLSKKGQKKKDAPKSEPERVETSESEGERPEVESLESYQRKNKQIARDIFEGLPDSDFDFDDVDIGDYNTIFTRKQMEERRGQGKETYKFRTKLGDKNYIMVWDGSDWLAFPATQKGQPKLDEEAVGELISETTNTYRDQFGSPVGHYVLARDTPERLEVGDEGTIERGGYAYVDQSHPRWRGYPFSAEGHKPMSGGAFEGGKKGQRFNIRMGQYNSSPKISQRELDLAVKKGWLKFKETGQREFRDEERLEHQHPVKGKLRIRFYAGGDESFPSSPESSDVEGRTQRADVLQQRKGRLRKLVDSDSSGGEAMDEMRDTLRLLNKKVKEKEGSDTPTITLAKVTASRQSAFEKRIRGYDSDDEISDLYDKILELKSKVQKKQRRKKSD